MTKDQTLRALILAGICLCLIMLLGKVGVVLALGMLTYMVMR